MTPSLQIINADVLDGLRQIPDESVHCCVTSPPYWGLRDYSVKGQLGLEQTPEEYVAKMVEVFREVRRVLRKDGVCFVNLGDSYAANRSYQVPDGKWCDVGNNKPSQIPPGLKPKDLCGIPWRVAFALQADGWVLRQEIIWSKPNPMPEPVTDRCTKSHESIFLFAKATWSGPAPGIFSHISDEDARWLAMFVDTEGNICIKRSQRQESGRMQYTAQVAFANTSRALLETAQKIVGIGSFHERKGKNSPMFYWQMAGQQARDFLYRIYPFLIVKRRQAALAIHVQDVLNTRGKKRPGGYRAAEHTDFLETAWARMKLLNHFGNPDLSDVPAPVYGRWSASARYFWDAEAVKEKGVIPEGTLAAKGSEERFNTSGVNSRPPEYKEYNGFRNRRSVWTINSEPYPEAHFATYPTALVKPCILAGTSAKGCCPKCGKPWERVVERVSGKQWPNPKLKELSKTGMSNNGTSGSTLGASAGSSGWVNYGPKIETTGWQPGCECGPTMRPGFEQMPYPPTSCTVLDPFAGSGTTGQVALELGRNAVLIELNPEYVKLINRRCNVTPGLALA